MTTALTLTPNGGHATLMGSASVAFEPNNIAEAMQLAQILHQSGLMPDGFRNPQAIVTAIIYGRELGLSAMQSVRGIHVIKGRPTMSADMMVALIKRSPVCEYFRLVESTPTVATYETKRKDEPKPVSMSYTIDQAKAAKALDKETWKAHPDAMLRARCSTALGRAVYQDLVMGVYDPDELEPAPKVSNVVVSAPEPAPAPTGEVVQAEVVEEAPKPIPEAPTPWEKASKRLRAIVGKGAKQTMVNVTTYTDAMKEYLRVTHGVESTKDLNPDQLNGLADAIEENPSFLLAFDRIPAHDADGHSLDAEGAEHEGGGQ